MAANELAPDATNSSNSDPYADLEELERSAVIQPNSRSATGDAGGGYPPYREYFDFDPSQDDPARNEVVSSAPMRSVGELLRARFDGKDPTPLTPEEKKKLYMVIGVGATALAGIAWAFFGDEVREIAQTGGNILKSLFG